MFPMLMKIPLATPKGFTTVKCGHLPIMEMPHALTRCGSFDSQAFGVTYQIPDGHASANEAERPPIDPRPKSNPFRKKT